MNCARPARSIPLLLLLACGQAPSATPATPEPAAALATPAPAPPAPAAVFDDPQCCMKLKDGTSQDFFSCSPVPAEECRLESWPGHAYTSTRALTRAELDEQLALFHSTYEALLDPARSADTPKELRTRAMSWDSCLRACRVLVSEEGGEETMD